MVGICLLTLVPNVVGGTETYARALCRALHKDGELAYTAFLPSLAADAAGEMPSEVIAAYRASRNSAGRLLSMGGGRLLPGRVARAIRAHDPDVVHFPLTTAIPRLTGVSTVVTVHDLQHLVLPKFFSRPERAFRRLVYEPSIRQASAVIAISEHAKRTIVDLLRLPDERITVVHFGLDHSVLRPGSEDREAFLLYPANRWPHKNHDRLFEAFRSVRRDRPDLRLVLTGAGHDRAVREEGIETRGRVPYAELVRLYQTASGLVFPSLYEGFGQPTLEAMACGCPVACSNTTALPEVCQQAAVYFDPTDVTSMTDAIFALLRDPDAYRRLGLERAAQFTWTRAAGEHERVYRNVLG